MLLQGMYQLDEHRDDHVSLHPATRMLAHIYPAADGTLRRLLWRLNSHLFPSGDWIGLGAMPRRGMLLRLFTAPRPDNQSTPVYDDAGPMVGAWC